MIKGYYLEEGKNEHGPEAKSILFTVLEEFGLDKSYPQNQPDLDQIEKAYRDGFFGLIKNDNGETVGIFGLIRKTGTLAEIRKMYLLPEARGKGLGKWMVRFLIGKAKSLGYEEIQLDTASKFVSAMNLYRKAGFTEKYTPNQSPSCDRAFFMKL